MAAQQTRTEVIANNLANMNTTAFKRNLERDLKICYIQEHARPRSVLGSSRDEPTAPAIQVGRGTRSPRRRSRSSTRRGRLDPQDPGHARSTVAIDGGDGYFPVQLTNGNTAYTRDGSFQISDQGVQPSPPTATRSRKLWHQDPERRHADLPVDLTDRRRERLEGARARSRRSSDASSSRASPIRGGLESMGQNLLPRGNAGVG